MIPTPAEVLAPFPLDQKNLLSQTLTQFLKEAGLPKEFNDRVWQVKLLEYQAQLPVELQPALSDLLAACTIYPTHVILGQVSPTVQPLPREIQNQTCEDLARKLKAKGISFTIEDLKRAREL